MATPRPEIAYDHDPAALIVEADTLSEGRPGTGGSHVPSLRLYGDGFVVYAGQPAPANLGTDAIVMTGHLSEEEIQNILWFIHEAGFFDLEESPQSPPADADTAHITVNLADRSHRVQVHAPDSAGAPEAFTRVYERLTELRPADATLFEPDRGTLYARLFAGQVSDVVRWPEEMGVNLANAATGIPLQGEIFKRVRHLLSGRPGRQAYREDDSLYQLWLRVDWPRRLPLSHLLGRILESPQEFEGQEVTVVGYYRGWDLLGEANAPPPVTRSDWVIADATGAIYVSAASAAPAGLPFGPGSGNDLWRVLHLSGVVRLTAGGQPYLEASQVQFAEADEGPEVPEPAPLVELAPPAIALHRTGGLAGLVQHLYIYDDGRFVAEDDKRGQGGEGTLRADELDRLWTSLEEIGFFDLDNQYGLGCPDCFVYVITVRQGERVKAVRTFDGSVPEKLEGILTSLVTLLDRGLEEK
ncbi:MAG TPA: hypothetical protein EYP49_21380 [Anaerolineae bacterium]|nr:hypothetical protein [Anaerolineae bacterium]